MVFADLVKLYEARKEKFGAEAYRHISDLLMEAKELHRIDFLKHPTPRGDHEQSWRSFKGKNLEKLIAYIIRDGVESLGLKLVDGNTLDKTKTENLSKELSEVKRRVLVDYGEFGAHMPDLDIIIYEPKTYKVIAAISSKVTLRERIAQTGYWKIKLSKDEVTKNIKVFFITPDEDRTLTFRTHAKKGRAIVEVDTDGSYVMSETLVEEDDKVKMFDHFIEDLKTLANRYREREGRHG
ncbi:MAG: BsaWI family type II restriction enzyme [candidate division Zixibacteria bacterium]|nr:BsaWI family type II restriction enzyme [candidate division Zixibacteria bacterium]